MSSADVAIIGAGPAGAWAATILARDGARVLLIDPSHPREKPCGGGVTGRALAIVGDALAGHPPPASPIRSIRFLDSALGESASMTLDGTPRARESPLVVSSRRDFDGALLALARSAGADILSARATDIAVHASGRTAFRIDTAAGPRHAGQLIGADGVTSLVRRRLGRSFTRDQLSIATGYFAHGVTSDEIVIELIADPPGYIWSFPRPTHLAVGICAQADAGVTAGALRARVREWLQATALARDAALEPYSWPIPSLGARDFEQLTPGGAGWFLVGDAAGLVDPITREGIYFALQSAQWAAEAVASDCANRARHYAERVRDGIASDLARAARLKTGFFRRRFTRLLMQGLRQSSQIRAVVADLVAGRQGYRGLRRRLVRTFELGLAMKLARSYIGRSASGRSG
jgi:geranylgeranyl reductase family protein